MQFVTEGNGTGDMQSFLRGVPTIVNEEAIEDCIIWKIAAYLGISPEFLGKIRREIAHRRT